LKHKYAIQADMVSYSMTNNSMLEKEKPTLYSDPNIKLNEVIEIRSENDRRKDFDRRSPVGRRRSSNRRQRKEP
jgi:hypothetical protein